MRRYEFSERCAEREVDSSFSYSHDKQQSSVQKFVRQSWKIANAFVASVELKLKLLSRHLRRGLADFTASAFRDICELRDSNKCRYIED
jgi:hypothetical protein